MPALNQNRVDEILDDAAITAIQTNISQIINHLPGGGNISLDDDERRTLLAMDVDNRIQASKLLDVMAGPAGAYIPSFIAAANVTKDTTLFDQMVGIETGLEDALQRVRDLKRIAGHEAMMAANTAYGIIEIAAKAGLPGAQAAYELLKQRFAGQGGGAPQQPNP